MEPKIITQTAFGVDLTSQNKCRHYHSDLDIVAIKFKCCGKYYACYMCHLEMSDHPAQRWSLKEWSELAILCGMCGNELTISEYVACDSSCLLCLARFNPGCKKHWELYFEVPAQ